MAILESLGHWFALRVLKWRVVIRAHPLRTRFLLLISISVVLVIAFRHLLWIHVPIWVKAISHPIFVAAQSHPLFGRTVHVLFNAIPDTAFALLAVSGLAYLVPKKYLDKIEELGWVRIFLLILFVTFGFSAIVINAIKSENQEFKDAQNEDRMGVVLKSVTNIQIALSPKSVQMTEVQRRQHLLDSVRDQYILEQKDVDPEILSGNKMPPDTWLNQKLSAMGEIWQFHQKTIAQSSHATEKTIVVRSSQVTVAAKAGDDTAINVAIKVNHNGPIKAFNYEAYGAQPVFPGDVAKQKEVEDELWNAATARSVTAAPFQLPSQEENIGLPMTLKAVSEATVDAVKNGTLAYYFISHVVDQQGKTLLDYCVHVDAKSTISYCREHNGP